MQCARMRTQLAEGQKLVQLYCFLLHCLTHCLHVMDDNLADYVVLTVGSLEWSGQPEL